MNANTDAPDDAPADPTASGVVHGDAPDVAPVRTYTMREAAGVAGVSLDTIKRRRRDGAFPNAEKVDRAWRIPAPDLAAAATEAGWTLTLDAPVNTSGSAPVNESGAAPGAASGSSRGAASRSASMRIVELETDARHREEALKRTTAERDQARRDLEHVRAELDRVKAENAELGKAVAVAEAVEGEVRGQVEHAHVELGVVRARADAAVDSLGWMGRRRYRKARQQDETS